MTFSAILAWPIAVLIADMQRHVLCYNEQWMTIYGVDRDEEPIRTLSQLKSGLTARSVYDDLNASLKHQDAWSGVLVNRHFKEYIMSAKGEQFDPVLVDLIIANWEHRPK